MFPLQVVLLPGEYLPLHIFEERYKEMIGMCLDEERPFGVVLAEKSGIRRIGCTARITAVIQKFQDGRMNIATEGIERFRILQTYQTQSYLTADVEFFEDDPEARPVDAVVEKVIQTFQEQSGNANFRPEDLREAPVRLSFQIGAALQLSHQEKQALLESVSLSERLERLIRYIREKNVRTEHVADQRERASRNGHPPR